MRIGILGAGQLGRMLALSAHPLGIQCTTLDPSPEPCAADVCSHLSGEFEDYQKLFQLAQTSDVITYEFENVPVESARWLAERLPVYPPPQALEVSQDRVVEKTFFQNLGIPTPAFRAIETKAEYDAAIQELELPIVLKTRRFGYDGKGQAVVRTTADVDSAWDNLGGRPLIAESFVQYNRELSVIAVRGRDGTILVYPLTQNIHREGMLRQSLAPAPSLRPQLQPQAERYIRVVLEKLNYVGVLAIEWFELDDGLMANEMAPRVHNSGHWTIDGAVTSQFENHIRAVAGLPLGSVDSRGHSVMYNWIGTHPRISEVLRIPEAKIHWYGKQPRARRKIGHVTLTSPTTAGCLSLMQQYEQQFSHS